MNLAEKAKKHTKEMATKYAGEINAAIANSAIYRDDSLPPLPENPNNNTIISVLDATSTQQIYENALKDHKIAVLNFASYEQPGGGFLAGSRAQEECLCHESFLYNVLSNMESFYETNREDLNLGLYRNAAIYTPEVVFEDPDNCLRNNVGDVITCAAPNKELFMHGFGSHEVSANRAALASRIDFILHVAAVNHVEILVLGAFGCGVFGQDATEVATIFKHLLQNRYKGYFYRVVFSIPEDCRNYNLQKFQKVFEPYNRRNRIYWSMDTEDFISMVSFVCASAGIDLLGTVQDLNYRLKIKALKENDAKKDLLEQVKKISKSPAALSANIMIDFDETDDRYIQVFYKKAAGNHPRLS